MANPIPLAAPDGRVYAYACGHCHKLGAMADQMGKPEEDAPPADGPDEGLAAFNREMAADCCTCRTCGKVRWMRGTECASCTERQRAEWEAGAPEREAAREEQAALREAALARSLDRDAAGSLAVLMSEISEDHYCASWLVDLEFILWGMLQGGDRGFGFSDVAEEEIAALRRLSEKCGGWLAWREEAGGEMFVTLDEWAPQYAAKVTEWERQRAEYAERKQADATD